MVIIGILGGCLDYDALTRGRDAASDDLAVETGDLSTATATMSADGPLADSASAIDSAAADLAHPDWCTGATLCPGGFKICDGFEAATPIDVATWTTSSYNGSLLVDYEHACRGQKAVHVQANANTGHH